MNNAFMDLLFRFLCFYEFLYFIEYFMLLFFSFYPFIHNNPPKKILHILTPLLDWFIAH